jgi:hypothetical protein
MMVVLPEANVLQVSAMQTRSRFLRATAVPFTPPTTVLQGWRAALAAQTTPIVPFAVIQRAEQVP